MATNLKHNFEDTHISLNVIEPTNVTGNDAHIARKFWTDQEKPVVNNQPVSKDTKNSWYGQFMSCMEIDWGNAKGDDENNFDKSTISESEIEDLLFTNGIKTSDELLTVLCWLFRNRYVAPLPIYSISWNGNGATDNAFGGSTQVTQGETVTIPTSNPKREYTISWSANGGTGTISGGSSKMEYTFSNWWTSATEGDQVTNATVPTGDSIYYAHWTPNTITLPTTAPKRKYTISWSANGGTGTPTGGTTEVTYTFNNWWTKTSGGTQVTPSTTTTTNATYYAHWTAPTSITLPTTNPTRSGYTFKGWAKSSSATTPNVTTNTIPTDNVTYYAVWESSINYYWYVGQTNPLSMSSITPIVTDNESPGWRLIGATLPTYSSTNKLWSGNNVITTGSSLAKQYIAIPANSTACPRDGFGADASTVDIYTKLSNITISGVEYKVYETVRKMKKHDLDIY